MKTLCFLIILALVALNIFAGDTLSIVVTYPYIESIAKEIGKEKVDVFCLSRGNEDPHFVVPRPSFIGRLRKADIFIINGASLEIGFVPPLLRQANNRKVNPGNPGFLDLSQFVSIINKPEKVSRAEGDIHPEGNPHFLLDYYNIEPIAAAIHDIMIKNKPEQKEYFNQNYNQFIAQLHEKIKDWDSKITVLSNIKIIQYHRLFDYFFKRAQITIFAEIEPKPGIPPTARHSEEIVTSAKNDSVHSVVIDVYHDKRAAEEIAKRINTKFLILPHDVRAQDDSKDIFTLFDTIIRRLSND
ncbi:MAG: adhesin [Candidatus Fischerbacteria bacterium RBG_13_37_8]|uniref:Adhesin n=1 Tax=Candidatus Fischerbacteria bacterium RBG_13_37_8 TaxID=1817863 RepID=A0A1F5VVU8_9BACT|nr:MAG: adhesin [Candidatus Fischerbacteria bacterium RBG_13_37_8]